MAGMVVRTSDFGAVVAPDDEQSVAQAMVAGEGAKMAARRYFDIELQPMLIAPPSYFREHADSGCAIQFEWPFFGQIEPRQLPRSLMQHEMGHAIFMKYLAPPSGEPEYGGMAPDWLDEMAGLAFEDDDGIEERRVSAVRYAWQRKLIPVSRLFSMTHPEWRRSDTQISSGIRYPDNQDTPAYYVTIRLLFDLLIARTNNERIIRDAARRVRQHEDIDTWLLRNARVQDFDALDRLMILHARTHPSYLHARAQARTLGAS